MVIQTTHSPISAGTELLIYRGQVPENMALDDTLPDLSGTFKFPFKYGYALIGQVVALGPDVPTLWQGRLVFAFHSHESHFIATPGQVFSLPDNMAPQNALFLPNMETAINLVMDGKPLVGERVILLGQGVVGLLTTAVLAQFPLQELLTVDAYPLRREASLVLGAHQSLSPAEFAARRANYGEADLIYELSGQPAVLNEAIAVTGFDSRIIIGSWYGNKRAQLDLGGHFHRRRIRLISSQVSTIASGLQGRWTKARRLALAWQMLQKVAPAHLITHHFPLSQAAAAYNLLDQTPEQAIQVVLSYAE